jgi:hypothetical protein
MEDESMSVDEKCEIAEGAASTAVERLKDDPDSQVAYKMTESAAYGLRKIITKKP